VLCLAVDWANYRSCRDSSPDGPAKCEILSCCQKNLLGRDAHLRFQYGAKAEGFGGQGFRFNGTENDNALVLLFCVIINQQLRLTRRNFPATDTTDGQGR
jgi:hypothetical protein